MLQVEEVIQVAESRREKGMAVLRERHEFEETNHSRVLCRAAVNSDIKRF